MTISVQCANGHGLKAPESLAGKTVRCPKCGSPVSIPKIDEQIVDLGAVDSKAVDASPVDASPVDASPVDASPVDANLADLSPAGLDAADPGPVDLNGVDLNAVDLNAVDLNELSAEADPLGPGPVTPATIASPPPSSIAPVAGEPAKASSSLSPKMLGLICFLASFLLLAPTTFFIVRAMRSPDDPAPQPGPEVAKAQPTPDDNSTKPKQESKKDSPNPGGKKDSSQSSKGKRQSTTVKQTPKQGLPLVDPLAKTKSSQGTRKKPPQVNEGKAAGASSGRSAIVAPPEESKTRRAPPPQLVSAAALRTYRRVPDSTTAIGTALPLDAAEVSPVQTKKQGKYYDVKLPQPVTSFALDPIAGTLATISAESREIRLYPPQLLQGDAVRPKARLRLPGLPNTITWKQYKAKSLFIVGCIQTQHCFVIDAETLELLRAVPAHGDIVQVNCHTDPADPWIYYRTDNAAGRCRIEMPDVNESISQREFIPAGVADRGYLGALSRYTHGTITTVPNRQQAQYRGDGGAQVKMDRTQRFAADTAGAHASYGKTVYSGDLAKELGELDFEVQAFFRRHALAAGVDGGNLCVASLNSFSTLARVPLPADFPNEPITDSRLDDRARRSVLRMVVALRRSRPNGIYNHTRLLVDDTRGIAVLAHFDRMLVLPLKAAGVPLELINPERLAKAPTKKASPEAVGISCSFPIRDGVISQDGRLALVSSESRRSEATVQSLAVIDLVNGKVLAERKIAQRAKLAAVDAHHAYLFVWQQAGYSAVQSMNVKDLSGDRQVAITTNQKPPITYSLGSKFLTVDHQLFRVPDLALATQSSSRTPIRRVGGLVDVHGVLFDSQLTSRQWISRLTAITATGSVNGLRGFWGNNSSSGNVRTGVLATRYVHGRFPVTIAQVNRSIGVFNIADGSLIHRLSTPNEVPTRNSPPTLPLLASDDMSALIVDDVIYPLALDFLAKKEIPMPLHVVAKHSHMTLDVEKAITLSYQVRGGKPPYKVTLEIPGLAKSKQTVTVNTADGMARFPLEPPVYQSFCVTRLYSNSNRVAEGLARKAQRELQSMGVSFGDARKQAPTSKFLEQAVDTYATRTSPFAEQYLGRKQTGLPIGVAIHITAVDSANANSNRQHYVLVELSKRAVLAAGK